MAGEKTTKEVTVSMESQVFPRTMLFNRFAIERCGSFRIFYFTLMDDEEHVRDAYACAIDEDTIQRHKEDLLSFVARAGTDTPPDVLPWKPKQSTISSIDIANVIRGSRTGAIAELRLNNFSTGDAIEAHLHGKSTVEAAPIALLRCEEGLQRTMFLSIYADEKSKTTKAR
jgi:hypothetical protein